MEKNEINKVSTGELISENNEASETKSDLVDYSISSIYRFLLIGILVLYITSLFVPILSSSFLLFFERNSTIAGSLFANLSSGSYLPFLIVLVFCFLIPLFLIISLFNTVFKSSPMGFYLVAKVQEFRIPVYSLIIFAIISVLQMAMSKSSLGIGWFLFVLSYLGIIFLIYKLSNTQLKPLQQEGELRLKTIIKKINSIIKKIIIVAGILIAIIIAFKFKNIVSSGSPKTTNSSDFSQSYSRPDSSSNSMSKCYIKGIEYYKEIGSYPNFSTGEDTETEVEERCQRSNGMAFGQ